MAQGADSKQGHSIPTLYGFPIVERAEPPPPMVVATVKKDWDQTETRIKGDLDVAIYVRIDALPPKLEEEVKECMQHLSPPNPEDLHPDTRAEICPGWKGNSDELE